MLTRKALQEVMYSEDFSNANTLNCRFLKNDLLEKEGIPLVV